MTLVPAVALALAVSAPPAAPAAPSRGPRPAAAAAAPVACTRYRPQVEKNELVPEQEVAAWGSAALERAGLLDPASPCFLHVRVTAGPTRTGGREDGWVAHVSLSSRRYLRDGKLVTREKGMLFVEPRREAIVARVRAFVEDYARGLGAPADGGGERGFGDKG